MASVAGTSSDAFLWGGDRDEGSDRITSSSRGIDFLRPDEEGARSVGNYDEVEQWHTG